MIVGTDTSRYQPIGTYDPGAFEVVNADEGDAGGIGGDFTATILRNVAEGRPWGVYIWTYPGQRVGVERAMQRVANLAVGQPPMGYWIDYEEGGVEQWQIDDAYAVADAFGLRIGLYSYLYLLNGGAADPRGRPLWIAYYPGWNDGSYPAGQESSALAWGAKLWQFTSSANAAVGLDRNVVLDEPWYYSLTAGAPIPSAPAKPRRFPMFIPATSSATPAVGMVYAVDLAAGIRFHIVSPERWTELVDGGIVSGYGPLDLPPAEFNRLRELGDVPAADPVPTPEPAEFDIADLTDAELVEELTRRLSEE